MDYEYSVYDSKRSKGGMKAAFIVFSILIISGIVFGALIIYNQMEKAYNAKLEEAANTIEETYSEKFDEMMSLISELEKKTNSQSLTQTINTSSLQNLVDSQTIIDISESVIKSIVTVTVTVPSTRYQSGFYSYTIGGIEGTGTGIIITDDGYVTTNYHVVEYYDLYENVTITVTLYDGTEFDAEFIGGDEKNDIAVLKILPEKIKLYPAILGSSDNLKVGEIVLAVGNPLGIEFAGSITMGIVSALDRFLAEENTAEKMIQTDAAINPGNSGGALVNIKGEVVGITTKKIAKTDVEGLGFAIPIDYAKPIISDLIEYGYVKDRPATGISGETISSSVARRYGVPQGVIITEIEENSGAFNAGLKVNDIITEINGVEILSMTDIQQINSTYKIGDTVTVKYYRNNEYYETEMILAEDRGR